MFIQAYKFEETGVGCEAHGDPTCLCDVIITKPVEVKHSLGMHPNAVLFSATVHRQSILVRDNFEKHMAALLGLYDAAAIKFRGKSALTRGEEEIAHADRREHEGDHRHFEPTPEQEGWMRRNIPLAQAAFIVDQHPETVRQWRKANGVKIDLGVSDFQYKNATPTRKNIRPYNYGTSKINVFDPDVRKVLEDRTLTIDQAGALLGCSGNVVYRARQRLHIPPLPRRGAKRAVDWDDPKVIAILDGGMSGREAAEALGCGLTTVHTRRKMRDQC